MGMQENLSAIVRENVIKQSFIAEKAGITDQKIGKILNLGQELKVNDLVSICKAIKVTPNELLDEEDKVALGIVRLV